MSDPLGGDTAHLKITAEQALGSPRAAPGTAERLLGSWLFSPLEQKATTVILVFLLGVLLHFFSGFTAWMSRSTTLGTISSILGSLCLATVAVTVLAGIPVETLTLPWSVPGGGIRITIDALSAIFLLPIALLSALAAVYARSYWDAEESGPRTRAAIGVLIAGMALVVTAGQGLWFLLCWELMALSAWVAMSAQHRDRSVRAAGWIYLIFTHLGTACLTAMVVLMGLRSGSLDWIPFVQPHSLDNAIVILAIAGFGAKAGLLPLHAWLPSAHASAPSHVSALLSGVMLKTGIYGILRITGLMPEPLAWWGLLLIGLGAISALYGIASALTQSDYKRLLACSSIENLGIITLAVGLALWSKAHRSDAIAILALSAALLHVWHHAVLKGLLFFGAGAILHGAHTRQLDRLGGLLKHMPIAGVLILIGAAAGAGLPGLAAFASEWPLYLAGLSTGSWTGVIVVITLALCGGAALAAYTKFYGTVFLGAARTTASAQAHEPKASMLSPMIILAVLLILLALALPLTLQVVRPIASETLGVSSPLGAPTSWSACKTASAASPNKSPDVLSSEVVSSNFSDFISLSPYLLSLSTLALLVFGTLLFLALKSHLKKAPLSRSLTWDCGYADPQASMQYTARSFTRVLGDELTPHPIQPHSDISPAKGLFPSLAKLSVKAGDGVLDRIFVPFANRVAEFFQKLRLFQQGHLAMYLLYILITTAVLLAVALVGG